MIFWSNKLDTCLVINRNNTAWYKSGQNHRESSYARTVHNGSAIIREWYKNGNLHNLRGESVIGMLPSGVIYKQYFLCGIEKDEILDLKTHINDIKNI